MLYSQPYWQFDLVEVLIRQEVDHLAAMNNKGCDESLIPTVPEDLSHIVLLQAELTPTCSQQLHLGDHQSIIQDLIILCATGHTRLTN